MTKSECGGYRPNRNESLDKGMERVTRMYLHIMPTCSSNFDRNGVTDDDLVIYETFYK